MINYNLFPTPVTVFNDVITDEQCNDIVEYMRDKATNSHDTLNEKSNTSFNTGEKALDIIQNNIRSCKDIYTTLHKFLNRFTDHIGSIEVQISNSWVTYTGMNGFLKKHVHPMSYISAALYLKVDEKSSPIVFHNPNNCQQLLTYQKNTDFSYEWFMHKPSKGDLILFPSWLQHSSHNFINKTEERVILSFNTVDR